MAKRVLISTSLCILLQTVGMDAAQRAAGAVVSLVDGGPPPAPGPPDGITTTLAGMSKAQLYEILAQMKGLIQQNPAQARQILVTSPQLAKALFQVCRVIAQEHCAFTEQCAVRPDRRQSNEQQDRCVPPVRDVACAALAVRLSLTTCLHLAYRLR